MRDQLLLLEWKPRPTTAEEWERLLRSEGLPAEPEPIPSWWKVSPSKSPITRGTDYQRRIEASVARAIINRGVLEMAEKYLRRTRWVCKFERQCWAYFCEGLTIRETAKILGASKSRVGVAVEKHKRELGI